MIWSFRDRETEKVARGFYSSRYSRDVQKRAKKRLDLLNSIGSLGDLEKPRSMRLKKLKGQRLGQYSIRVNDQYRICFGWIEGRVINVELIDYH